MKDTDRNINSPLYAVSNTIHINNISSNIVNDFTNVFKANANNSGIWSTQLQPGEYYYRQIIYSVESNNSNYIVQIYGNNNAYPSYPSYSYFIQSPLVGTTEYITIPYHFIIDSPTTIAILVQNIEENSTIKSVIEIKKRVE